MGRCEEEWLERLCFSNTKPRLFKNEAEFCIIIYLTVGKLIKLELYLRPRGSKCQ